MDGPVIRPGRFAWVVPGCAIACARYTDKKDTALTRGENKHHWEVIHDQAESVDDCLAPRDP
jgi:hypothetical protein